MNKRHLWIVFVLCLLVVPFGKVGGTRAEQPVPAPGLTAIPTLAKVRSQTPTAVPGGATLTCPSTSEISPPGINITREQYNEALAKWLSQGVQEYELVVMEGGGLSPDATWKIRVRVNNGKSRVVSFRYLSGYESPPARIKPADLEYLTIEHIFAVIDEISSPEGTCKYYDTVRFDPNLGYPASIFYGLAGVYDANGGIAIKSLKILKRLTPGMPRTGNPGM